MIFNKLLQLNKDMTSLFEMTSVTLTRFIVTFHNCLGSCFARNGSNNVVQGSFSNIWNCVHKASELELWELFLHSFWRIYWCVNSGHLTHKLNIRTFIQFVSKMSRVYTSIYSSKGMFNPIIDRCWFYMWIEGNSARMFGTWGYL
jgi:hypothetical protein